MLKIKMPVGLQEAGVFQVVWEAFASVIREVLLSVLTRKRYSLINYLAILVSHVIICWFFNVITLPISEQRGKSQKRLVAKQIKCYAEQNVEVSQRFPLNTITQIEWKT